MCLANVSKLTKLSLLLAVSQSSFSFSAVFVAGMGLTKIQIVIGMNLLQGVNGFIASLLVVDAIVCCWIFYNAAASMCVFLSLLIEKHLYLFCFCAVMLLMLAVKY